MDSVAVRFNIVMSSQSPIFFDSLDDLPTASVASDDVDLVTESTYRNARNYILRTYNESKNHIFIEPFNFEKLICQVELMHNGSTSSIDGKPYNNADGECVDWARIQMNGDLRKIVANSEKYFDECRPEHVLNYVLSNVNGLPIFISTSFLTLFSFKEEGRLHRFMETICHFNDKIDGRNGKVVTVCCECDRLGVYIDQHEHLMCTLHARKRDNANHLKFYKPIVIAFTSTRKNVGMSVFRIHDVTRCRIRVDNAAEDSPLATNIKWCPLFGIKQSTRIQISSETANSLMWATGNVINLKCISEHYAKGVHKYGARSRVGLLKCIVNSIFPLNHVRLSNFNVKCSSYRPYGWPEDYL